MGPQEDLADAFPIRGVETMSEGRAHGGNEFPTEPLRESAQDSFDLLAEEFAERCRKGELPSIGEYESRYPEHLERIRRLFPTVALIEQLRGGRQATPGAEPARPMPETLGEFRIIRELGRGGMGVVYEASQESLGRHVAVKVVHARAPRRQAAATVSARGAGGRPAPPHQHRPDLRGRRARRPSLLRDAVHPGERARCC